MTVINWELKEKNEQNQLVKVPKNGTNSEIQ